MDGSARYAQDSQLNVPAKDASPTTIRLYEIWKRLHCSQNHMKRDKMLRLCPELLPLKDCWPGCEACALAQATIQPTRKKKLPPDSTLKKHYPMGTHVVMDKTGPHPPAFLGERYDNVCADVESAVIVMGHYKHKSEKLMTCLD